MGLRIKANTFLMKRYLEVDSGGVTFCETAFAGGARRFGFHEIDCVLLSETHVLSFQVKQEVFRLPTRPDKEKHQRVIDTLIYEVRRAAGGG